MHSSLDPAFQQYLYMQFRHTFSMHQQTDLLFGIFVSAFGLKKDDVTNIITPDKANDIGDRLILFPQHLNSNITDDEIKENTNWLSSSVFSYCLKSR